MDKSKSASGVDSEAKARDGGPVGRTGRATYAGAGVDNESNTRAKRRMAALAAAATRPEVLAAVGPFAGLFAFETSRFREPVLVASADSVGTKVKIAALLDRYDTAGVDIVNHCVNDILTAGAEPLFFLDYIGGATLTEDQKVALVAGVSHACREAGCALLGGETAVLPDLYAPGDFDLAGFIVGAVERDAVIDGSRIVAGDVLLGLPSNGLHTNGYALVRKVFGVGLGGDATEERRRLDERLPELGATLGEALLTPHRSYLREVRPALSRVKAIAHVTGGGIIENVPRMLPSTGSGLAARLERGAWPMPPLFELIQRRGPIDDGEMYRVFNMGLGLVLAVAEGDADAVRRLVPESLVVGRVVPATGERVELV